ncbi:MAG: putative peptidoglycan binding domain-containing protein [Acidobacteriota bacterium]|nr:putative peptidoglycan binding domain-containing protein [Acidobacteriota bacterium]
MSYSRWTVAALLILPVLVGTAPLTAAAKTHAGKSAPAHKSAKASSSKSHAEAPREKSSKASSAKADSKKESSARTTSAKASKRGKSRKSGIYSVAAKPKSHGQQGIDGSRILEIQQALIRDHYMDGEPSGVWDQATRDALVRLQTENNWQTRIIPDSRALIKLGLGPSQQNLLNPETAAISPQRTLAQESVTGNN